MTQYMYCTKYCDSKVIKTEETKTMKPTDKDYIEALATEILPKLDNKHFGLNEVVARINQRNGVIKGYQLALDHTNHAELLEAAKYIVDYLQFDSSPLGLKAENLKAALTKSETSKLPNPPQD